MLSILSHNPDNKLTTAALVIMATGILLWACCKVFEFILNYGHEQQKKKTVTDELSFNPFVYVIYHVATSSTIKAFVSEDDCFEYFKKNFRFSDGYDWMGINISFYSKE